MFTSLKKNFIIFSVFWLVASATYSGFIAKWRLRDSASASEWRCGIAQMLDGTAYKPYVYRQFIPTTANLIADHAPEKFIYSGNEGKAVEIWFTKNVHYYLTPTTYFKFDGSYGLIAPQGVNILTLFLIFILVKSAWKQLDEKVRKHCLIALMINLPLFIVAGWPNEIRALGFLYISAVFLIAYTIQHYDKKIT